MLTGFTTPSSKANQCVLENSYVKKLLTQRFYLYLSIVIFLILMLNTNPNILNFHVTRFITNARLARLITSLLCIGIPILVSQLIRYSNIIRATHKTFDHLQARWYASSTSDDGTKFTQDAAHSLPTITAIPAVSTTSSNAPTTAAEIPAPSTPPNSPTAAAAKKHLSRIHRLLRPLQLQKYQRLAPRLTRLLRA